MDERKCNKWWFAISICVILLGSIGYAFIGASPTADAKYCEATAVGALLSESGREAYDRNSLKIDEARFPKKFNRIENDKNRVRELALKSRENLAVEEAVSLARTMSELAGGSSQAAYLVVGPIATFKDVEAGVYVAESPAQLKITGYGPTCGMALKQRTLAMGKVKFSTRLESPISYVGDISIPVTTKHRFLVTDLKDPSTTLDSKESAIGPGDEPRNILIGVLTLLICVFAALQWRCNLRKKS